jgi:hypothetical protein
VFEHALSPVALGWTTLSSMHWGKLKFENLHDMNGLNLKDTAHLLGRNMMEKIMDMVKDVAVLYKLEIELENRCEELSLDKKDRDSCMGVPVRLWMIFMMTWSLPWRNVLFVFVVITELMKLSAGGATR